MARQPLGQHFLTDAGWRKRIATALGGGPDSLWLEIGAGHGEMTTLLAERAARVVAVELDPRLLARLRERTKDLPNVEVVSGDILELDLARIAGLDSPPWAGCRAHVYGNLPYYITSPILHRLFESAARVEAIHVVVQLEVAARLTARPGRRDYGYLSVAAQFYTRPEILLRIPPGAFRPRPKVASALVRLRTPGERAQLAISSEKAFLEFVKLCFEQKRKTLANNLKRKLSGHRVERLLQEASLASTARAEELSVGKLAELFVRSEILQEEPNWEVSR